MGTIDHVPLRCVGTEWMGSRTYFQFWNNGKSCTLWRLHRLAAQEDSMQEKASETCWRWLCFRSGNPCLGNHVSDQPCSSFLSSALLHTLLWHRQLYLSFSRKVALPFPIACSFFAVNTLSLLTHLNVHPNSAQSWYVLHACMSPFILLWWLYSAYWPSLQGGKFLQDKWRLHNFSSI